MFTGESIAEFLTKAGTPAEFIKQETAPQIICYYFNYINLQDINKLKKAIRMLELETGENITTTNGGITSHFTLQFVRNNRPILRTAEAHETLKTARPLSLLLGKDTANKWNTTTPQELTHLLIAGTTGAGKSVALNSMISSLICYNTADEISLIIIDMKKIEYKQFEGIPHLLTPIVTEYSEALEILQLLIETMEERYLIIEETGKSNFKPLLVVIDELSDLILNNKECKKLLTRLLQKSRGAKIHFIVATQSPRASVLDGATLANLPSRLALTCSNARESVLILGHKGAEQLTGKGDAILKMNGTTHEKRLQVPYISKTELSKIIK